VNIEELAKKLEEHPELKLRFEELVRIVENPLGETDLADEAEERLILLARNLSREALQEWATSQSEKTARRLESQVKGVRKNIKKKSTGAQASEK
jgi:hypothetical protein